VRPGADDPRIAKAEEAYAALNAGDVDGAIERMDPDVVFDWSRSKSPYRGVYEGREAVRRLFEELRESFEEMEYKTVEWIPAGERLVRVGGVRGRGRGSGVEVAMEGGQVIEFADGLASRVTLYQTAEEALAAVAGDAER
jgi:ketosteroid isomerase-like protein